MVVNTLKTDEELNSKNNDTPISDAKNEGQTSADLVAIGDNVKKESNADADERQQEDAVVDKVSDETERKTKNPFRKFVPLDFPVSKKRIEEVAAFRRILNAPSMNVPALVIDRPEDALPVLSLYVAQQKFFRLKMPKFLMVSMEDFGIKFPLPPDKSYDFAEEMQSEMKDAKTFLGKPKTIPVFCDPMKWLNEDLINDFSYWFLDRKDKTILILEKKDLSRLQSWIDNDNSYQNGLSEQKNPDEKEGFSKCSVLHISQMNDDEKVCYFSSYLKKTAMKYDFDIGEKTLAKFVKKIIGRFSHDEVFLKAFEVFERGIVIAQETRSSRGFLTSQILDKALDEIAPVHNRAKQLLDMDDRLKKRIFGQDKAIDQVYETILSVCDDTDRKKPVVLGFFGPSGVGKTAMAEEVSLALTGRPVVQLNMAEYADDIKLSTLIGSSKGYVNSEEDGLLAQKIKEDKHAVFLLDEFEKAHPNVQKVFLGIFDKGSVYDNHSGQMDLSNVTFILTSNAGVRSQAAISLGSNTQPAYVADMELIKRAFPPELLGRIDAKIIFDPLSRESLSLIVDKFMNGFKSRFNQLGVFVSLSEKAKNEIIEKGLDPSFGARPLQNILKQKVKLPVEIGILKKTISVGASVIVNSIEENDIQIEEQKKPKKIISKSRPRTDKEEKQYS